MELWRRISGWDRVRLTGADLPGSLRQLSERLRLENIVWEDDLTAAFTVSRRDRKTVCAVAARRGDQVKLLQTGGFPQLWKTAAGTPILAGYLAALTAFTCWLPSRILFLSVEGNGEIPAARILEQAEECGLSFGVSRRKIRSEQIKNELLARMPELGWAGVNTRGCTAVLTVRPRQSPPEMPHRRTGNIVAARDGILTSVTVTAGTAVKAAGDAVKKGELLISGLTDLSGITVESAAEGEVFAQTVHEISAVLPRKTLQKTEDRRRFRRWAMIFGKKRINFYSDSGNLYPGCGKMVEVIPLVLPGGWEMPVALVCESFTASGEAPRERTRREAEALLSEAMRRQVLERTVAGTVRQEALALSRQQTLWKSEGKLYCREMIGRTADGVYLEDDAKDVRTSGECGAG